MTDSKLESKRLRWSDPETVGLVRPEVRRILESADAFQVLPAEERRKIASDMVKVSSYMANPDGLAKEAIDTGKGPVAAEEGQLAETLAKKPKSATEKLRDRLATDPGFAGEDFEGGALQEGTEQFKQLVQTVDFPKFVGGLIQNVFQAIVTTSIEQMRAYGELMANVAKSVDEFARDNISENNARDWLSDRFPDQLGVETESSGFGFSEDGESTEIEPRLAVTAEDPQEALRFVSQELQLPEPLTDISDPKQEQNLVLQARLQIARSRQQLLASMVMLGINRIVVTDGSIKAKVVFDMRAQDIAQRSNKASMHDRKSSRQKFGAAAVGFGWGGGVASSYSNENTHVATVGTAVDEDSESKAMTKAQLAGEVRVNFKSDYLPLERMATPEMISAIQGNAAPPERIVEGA